MSLKRKLEGEIEIRESAADVLHDLYENRPHHMPHSGASNFIQNCELHHGIPGTPGYIQYYNYTLDGKAHVSKNMIEEVDREKKLIRQRCIEGDLLDEYKTISGTCQVIPKDKETCTLKWILEYQKLHPGIPEPTALLDSLLSAAKDMDDHHHGIKK